MRTFSSVAHATRRFGAVALTLAPLLACTKSATLDDAISGKAPLVAAELAALETVLKEAGVQPSKARLFPTRKEFDTALTSNGGFIEGGHVVALRLIGGQLSHLEPVCALSELRSLAMPTQRIDLLAAIAGCSKLETLDLSGNRLRAIDSIGALRMLRTLRLDRNQIESAKGVGGLPLLQELSLRDNQLTRVDGISHLSELSTLALSGNKLTSLDALEDLPKLARLLAANNSLTTKPALERFPLVRDVDVSSNPIPIEAGAPVAAEIDAQPTVVRCSPAAAVDLPAETSGSTISGSGGCSTGLSLTTCEGAAGTLRGVSVVKRKVRGSSASLSLRVAGGEARAFLACGSRYVACTATPHHPCVVEGSLSRRSSTNVTMMEGAFWLEAVGDHTDGVSYSPRASAK